MILAPLRGVTIRCFRDTFAREIAEAGFTESVTPFISALPGIDPLRDRELRRSPDGAVSNAAPRSQLRVTPQFIGKDAVALGECLKRVRDAGFETADLNAGCPFPMVRNKGRGAGLLRTPDVLRRLLDVGCATLGDGRFSVKARLGVTRPDELLALMPILNAYPLRFLTVHARTAKQMYEGVCDRAAFAAVLAASNVPVVYNGDVALPPPERLPVGVCDVMVGRSFVRQLGLGPEAPDRVRRYGAASALELSGDRPVLGRLKELVAYWKDFQPWRRYWPVLKRARTVAEFYAALP